MAEGSTRPIVFAVRDLPIQVFGGRHGRHSRKFVLLTLATHADFDGGKCYPATPTIARECGLSVRATQKVLAWLRENGFLQIAIKASPLRTNLFTILMPNVTNARVHGDNCSSPRTKETGMVNGSTADNERQSAHNLPVKPTKIQPTHEEHAQASPGSVPSAGPEKAQTVPPKTPDGRPDSLTSTEAAHCVCLELGLAGNDIRWLIRDAIDARVRAGSEQPKQIAELMVVAWRRYRDAHPAGSGYAKSAKTFFTEPSWADFAEPASTASKPLSERLREMGRLSA